MGPWHKRWRWPSSTSSSRLLSNCLLHALCKAPATQRAARPCTGYRGKTSQPHSPHDGARVPRQRESHRPALPRSRSRCPHVMFCILQSHLWTFAIAGAARTARSLGRCVVEWCCTEYYSKISCGPMQGTLPSAITDHTYAQYGAQGGLAPNKGLAFLSSRPHQ